MQILILALVAALFFHDSLPPAQNAPGIPIKILCLIVLVPKILWVTTYALLCRITLHRLGTEGGPNALHVVDRSTAMLPFVAGMLYVTDLSLGLLHMVRERLGDVVLLDELVVILPTLGLIVASWWAYYPIDRRLRNAMLIRHLDSGQIIHPVWSRGQYIVSQLRHQVGLLLLPMLALWSWSEFVSMHVPASLSVFGDTDPRPLLSLGGSAAVFLFTPLAIRRIWDTTPLPPGQLRDRLIGMCREYRVGIRALLLWRTFGCMVNGAVLGMVGPLRYILLTDALLEGLTTEQIEAVMAHEIAHIKKCHVFWLLAVASTALGTFAVGWAVLLATIVHSTPAVITNSSLEMWLTDPATRSAIAVALATVCWVWALGWASRRFERQADSFAVRHLAQQQNQSDDETIINVKAIGIMISALGRVADLNRVSTQRKSWRHGSIAWRQDYLRLLVGIPAHRLPIDRQVRRIKAASALGFVTLVVLFWLEPTWL